MSNEIVNYDADWAAQADKYAKQDRGGEGSASMSTRGGILSLGEEQMPGNQMAVIILDSVLQNSYYANKYDPGAVVPPVCYAFTRDDPADMAPHIESMSRAMDYFMPQHITPEGQVGGCAGCSKAEWGSSDTGKGKACKNQYRLTLLPAGLYAQPPGRREWELTVFDTEQHYGAADAVFLSLPVTSGAAFERYRKTLRMQHSRPPHGALTRIYLTPDAKNQFSVNFELIELVPPHLTRAVLTRNADIVGVPFKGHEAPSAEPAPAFGGFRRK